MFRQTAIFYALVTGILVCAGTALAFDPKNIVLKDPSGDDNGPGTYQYPTDAVYKPGSFDLTSLEISDKGSTLEFKVKVRAKIEDPWNSKSWGGNGFSLQLLQVYINNKKGGVLYTLPGINLHFPKGQGWDKVVFISPQPKAKILAEVKTKGAKLLDRVVIPKTVSARGQEIIAVVDKKDLGTPDKSWGFQAVMQSNEGYADADSVLARKVNEYPGQHRFGGGSDYNCDPHAIDILAGAAKGTADEKTAQYQALKSYKCDASGNGDKAVVPLIYPGK